jgi:elongation factor G
MIDTPGFPDFIGQSIGALDAVETAAVVINASAGIEMIASRMMDWAAQRKLCRLIIVNKIDAENVDLPGLLASIQSAFGKECLPINLPSDNGRRVVDCFFNPAGESDFSSVADAHSALVDQVVEVDEALMSLYLEQGEISADQLHAPFEKALREGHLVPVCFVSARNGVGIQELLDIFVKLLPNPPREIRPCSSRARAKTRSNSGPSPTRRSMCLAHVFKVVMDPFVGKLGVFRVHQGHGHARYTAFRRRQSQAFQGWPPVHDAGRKERRDRQRRAWRHRGGGQGRRDRVRLCPARLARRGPYPHAPSGISDADARSRAGAEKAR